jgi:hypothetical protein
MPLAAAGVYSIWNETNDFVYAGMAGRGKSSEDIKTAQLSGKKTGLHNRLNGCTSLA